MQQLAFYFISFVFGTVIGSFLNVCIYRIPAGRSIVTPPSHCPRCGTRLAPRDLVPLFSYIFLKGKCRYCGARISLQYPAVELLTGMLFLAAAWRFGPSPHALGAVVLFSLLISVSVIDIHHRIIPNGIVLAGLFFGILLNFHSLNAVYNGLLGFFLGGGILLLVALAFRGGMGGGDIKLAAMMGVYLGWQHILLTLFLSFLFGSIIGMGMVFIRGKTLKDAIPFGPFLAAGGIVSTLWGDTIISWYLALFI